LLTVVLTISRLRVLGHDSGEAAIPGIRIFGRVLSIVSSPLSILSVVVDSLSVLVYGGRCNRRSGVVRASISALSTIATLTSAIAIALASISVTTVASVAITRSAVRVAIAVAVVAAWRRTILECLVVCFYLLEKFITEFLCAGNTFGTRSSNVEIHGLLALLAALWLHEA
jgi:hypothetical protein